MPAASGAERRRDSHALFEDSRATGGSSALCLRVSRESCLARASTSPGGTCSEGERSSGMPPTLEPMHGSARAMASISARGSPSVRDGSTKRSAASSSFLTASPDEGAPEIARGLPALVQRHAPRARPDAFHLQRWSVSDRRLFRRRPRRHRSAHQGLCTFVRGTRQRRCSGSHLSD